MISYTPNLRFSNYNTYLKYGFSLSVKSLNAKLFLSSGFKSRLPRRLFSRSRTKYSVVAEIMVMQ